MPTSLPLACFLAAPESFFRLWPAAAVVATRRSRCFLPSSEVPAVRIQWQRLGAADTLLRPKSDSRFGVDRKMEKEHIKIAMLRQEQAFRQQVHELHRVYRVQKQLMMQVQLTETNHHSKAGSVDAQARSTTMKMDRRQWCGNFGEKAMLEDFDLELTLATGVGMQERPANSDSEATMSSSTSAESESGRQFVSDSNVTLSSRMRAIGMMIQSCNLLGTTNVKMA